MRAMLRGLVNLLACCSNHQQSVERGKVLFNATENIYETLSLLLAVALPSQNIINFLGGMGEIHSYM